MPIAPYGGTLVDRRLAGDGADDARRRARVLPQVRLGSHALSDLYLIAVGGFSPLTGFMGSDDYHAVLERMTLADGLPWSVPVTLPVTPDEARAFAPGDEVALIAPDGEPAAILHVREVYGWDRDAEARAVYGTTDRAHPGVAKLDAMGELLVAGPIDYVYTGDVSGFPAHNLTPAQTRAEFRRRGWKTVVAFQTRNPVHRAHEYLQKCALESVDGLLLHPLVGDTKSDDIPAGVRMECYRVLLEGYYPAARVLLSVLPAAMRYAGPREAVFHAIMRRNYGCTHFIVGRDHAGVGSYYGTYEAQEIFDRVDLDRLGIVPMKFEHAFYCAACGGMGSTKTCPHGAEHHVILSGTRVREMLASGERPPAEFSRPEVADVLVRAHAAQPA
ncbi:MAG TPA: sulfate adenylyltransferase [Longimicrobium sp.]|nr:sulfate adenylyltransferase [Longimicrobium sp.]